MGRLKVYGESWDLPGSPTIPNPFADFIVEEEPSLQTPPKIFHRVIPSEELPLQVDENVEAEKTTP